MFSKIKRDCKIFLAHRRLPFILPFLSVLLVLGTIEIGLQLDDFLLQSTVQNSDGHNAITEMFGLVKNLQHIKSYLHQGSIPWWTSENFRIYFFRPLSAATHWLDFRLWPEYPALMHIQNLLWFMALVFCATLVYRKTMTPLWVAGLAALLYAIDDAHGMPAGWISNRNTLIAGVFSFLCIYFHLRWRLERWRIGALLAPVSFLLSLLSAEAGIATGAYLLSFELVLASDNRRCRVFAILPYAVLGLAWQIIYKAMKFGAAGSEFYIDPGRNPLAFLGSLFERIPFLLFGQWLLPDSNIHMYLPEESVPFLLIGVYALLTVILFTIIPLLKRDPVSRFWAVGMMLSLLPASAAFPDDRNLVFGGLGGMGLLAVLLQTWFEKPQWLPDSKIWRISSRAVIAILILVHFVAAPILLPLKSQGIRTLHNQSIEIPTVKLAEKIDLQDKIVVLINAPIPQSAELFPDICRKYGLSKPLQVSVLATGLNKTMNMNVYRVNDDTLDIERKNGFFYTRFDRLFRKSSDPMRIGQSVDLGKIRVQVLNLTEDQRPLKVRFSFPKSLDDPSLLFYEWKANRYIPFSPPKKGQTVVMKCTVPELF